MLSGFFYHSYFIGAVLILFGLSILCQIMIGIMYRKMIRE